MGSCSRPIDWCVRRTEQADSRSPISVPLADSHEASTWSIPNLFSLLSPRSQTRNYRVIAKPSLEIDQENSDSDPTNSTQTLYCDISEKIADFVPQTQICVLYFLLGRCSLTIRHAVGRTLVVRLGRASTQRAHGPRAEGAWAEGRARSPFANGKRPRNRSLKKPHRPADLAQSASVRVSALRRILRRPENSRTLPPHSSFQVPNFKIRFPPPADSGRGIYPRHNPTASCLCRGIGFPRLADWERRTTHHHAEDPPLAEREVVDPPFAERKG